MYHILSESIFQGNKKAAELAGYVDLGLIINSAFSCEPSITACCNETGIYIKKADILLARKKPKNSFVSLEAIIKKVYNCCEGTTFCANTSRPTYWINSGVIRPKKTIETISFDKVIKKAFKCCGLSECGCGSINLSIIKDVDNPTPMVGTNVTFTLTASNIGPESATYVVVTDILPSGYGLSTATPSSGTWTSPNWNIGTLLPGASETLTIVAEVLPTGNYNNTATIVGKGVNDNLINNTATINVSPVPALTTFTALDSYFPGGLPFTVDEIQLWTLSPLGMVTTSVIPVPFNVVSNQTDVINIINTLLGPAFIPTTTISGFNYTYTGTQAFQVILKMTGNPLVTYTFT